MSTELWLENLLSYSLQLLGLVLAGGILAWIFRIQVPRVVHLSWRLLLFLCVLFPLLQPWTSPGVPAKLSVEGLTPLSQFDDPVVAESTGYRFPTAEAIFVLVLVGIVIRLGWLGSGFFRLRVWRRNCRELFSLSPELQALQTRVGVAPQIYLSPDIGGPVTFGFFRPLVLLPEYFQDLDEKLQQPIVCHEFLHVRRRDWIFNVMEEILRSLFWFHPAIRWLINRIQISREQVVDQEVVRMTGARKLYLESLVKVASSGISDRRVPAPLLLQECQLTQRVQLMLKEVSMSKSRQVVSLVACTLLLGAIGWGVAEAFPLESPSPAEEATLQTVEAPKGPIRVGHNVQASKLVHRVEPVYPEMARAARVIGLVMLQVLVDEAGEVQDLKVLRGHPLLNSAALEAVRQWRYSPTTLNGQPVSVVSNVAINFVRAGETAVGNLTLLMDEAGILWEGKTRLEGEQLFDRVAEVAGQPIMIVAKPGTPSQYVKETVELLKRAGVEKVYVKELKEPQQ